MTIKRPWLVPFKGRKYSGHISQNFLWNYGSVYIMDNHRAALWCWFQHISLKEKYNLFHIDRHYDTLSSNLDIWIKKLPDIRNISIEQYLASKFNEDGLDGYTFSYDNYLSIFLKIFPELINKACFTTHMEGDTPQLENFSEYPIWQLPENLDYWLSRENERWIINLDLDFFCCNRDESQKIMFSQDYIDAVFSTLARMNKQGRIAVLTVALSPEWSGDWKTAEKICYSFTKSFGLDFILPT